MEELMSSSLDRFSGPTAREQNGGTEQEYRCPECHGREWIENRDTGEETTCPTCHGRGTVTESELP